MSTHLILPDPHAHPDWDNKRADWVGKLIVDLKPDVFVNLGDQWDFPSLSAYDKGKASFHGRNYFKDLSAGLEFSDRLWAPIKRAKKRRPFSVFLEGNHEERQSRVLELQPELDGAIGWDQLQLERSYDKIVRYTGSTPGIIEIDGITYAHFLLTGVSGRPSSAEHPAYTILSKQFQSSVVGHLHVLDYCQRTTVSGKRIHALVAGCGTDQVAPWAGEEICKMWCPGVAILHNVNQGDFDFEWVSLKRLEQMYGE